MTHYHLSKRVERLEAERPIGPVGRLFLWSQGQSLANALEWQKLTLEDRPLIPIRVRGVLPGETEPRPDPLFERDRGLLGI